MQRKVQFRYSHRRRVGVKYRQEAGFVHQYKRGCIDRTGREESTVLFRLSHGGKGEFLLYWQ
jgi:hypothetical protein